VSGQKLSDQRIVIYGAGSAGMGIADQIKDGLMILEGLTEEEAESKFWCVDRNGLLVESMGNGLRHAQMAYARPDAEVQHWEKENPDQKGLWLMDGESGAGSANEGGTETQWSRPSSRQS
jgi:malate dehydrogenase (oxaloacetate-decarboxylating)